MDAPRSKSSAATRPLPSLLNPRGKMKKHAWSFPTTSREPVHRQVAPASTKYSPNLDAVRGQSKSYTIGTKPLQRTKASTPAPGQYNVPSDNYKGKFFVSKLPKTSSIKANADAADREMSGPSEFLRAKGGKLSTVPRFGESKAETGNSVGPGSYSSANLPARRTPGPSFGKPSASGRGPAIAKSLRSVPGPGSYELTDRTIAASRLSNDVSFSGAVFISRHIDVDDDPALMAALAGGGLGPGGSGGGGYGGREAKVVEDQKFLRSTNQDIQRWKMMSALTSA